MHLVATTLYEYTVCTMYIVPPCEDPVVALAGKGDVIARVHGTVYIVHRTSYICTRYKYYVHT